MNIYLPGRRSCWNERPSWQILLTLTPIAVWLSSWYFDANANRVWFEPDVQANWTPVSSWLLRRW